MPETSTHSTPNAAKTSNGAYIQRLSSAMVTEDDDEPPSSASAPPPKIRTKHSTHGVTQVDPPPALKRGGLGMHLPFLHRKKTSTGVPLGIDPEKAPTPRTTIVAKSPNRLKALFTPVNPIVGPPPSYWDSIKATLRYSPLNFCLVFIPVSWGLHYGTHGQDTIVFVFSALGIIPLAALLGFGTEQIALRTSMSVGGLLNATLGNIVEMIIAGIALKECNLELVQSSLLGGLLSNLLLVLGMAFVVGGFRFQQQEFQPMVAQLNSSLMTASVISLIIPAAFHEYLEDRLPQGRELTILLQLSRGSAVLLILIYIAYLIFQFYSHNHLFLDTFQPSSSTSLTRVNTDTTTNSSVSSASSHEDHIKLNTPFALFLLVAVTALAYETAECLVKSLEGLVEAHPNVSTEWLTLIIIPIISNAAEHTTAVLVARKGKFDLALSVAVGSCIQISLFVIPVLVLVAWGMDKPLTLLFDSLETLVLFFSVLLVKFAIEDGKSHWMSGAVLIVVYVIVALCFWNFPDAPRLLQGQPLACT